MGAFKSAVITKKGEALRPRPLIMCSNGLVLGAVGAVFFVREKDEVPVQHVNRQYHKHHHISPALGEEKILIKSIEFHDILLLSAA